MALIDFGYGKSLDEGIVTDAHVLSLKTEPTRKGYAIRASDAANGIWLRLVQCAICALTVMAGIVLVTGSSSLVGAGSVGIWLLPSIGAYLIVAAIIWLARLSRRQTELHVDHRTRAFHLVNKGLLGAEHSRQTIRFEEVAKINLVDGLMSTDMCARMMNWDMARIDVVWRKSNVVQAISGDVAELEPLAIKLRQEVGMA